MLKKITEPVVLKIFLGLIILLKFTVSFNTGLFEDEAIYWDWSQSADPSYSFTTLSAIKLFSVFPGNVSEFTVRLPALLTNFIIIFFFIKTGNLFGFSERKILIALVLLFSLPFVTIYTSFISPDSMLLMFSVVSVYYSLRVIMQGTYTDWIFCGISFGLLLISKYTGIVFLTAFVIFIFFKRKDLSGLYIGKVLAAMSAFLIIISPLIFWNIVNEPVWLNYYVSTGADTISAGFGESILKFLSSQIAVMLPFAFLFILFITFIQIRKKNKSKEEIFLLFCSGFILIAFTVLAVSGKLKGNWAFTAYIPLAVSFLFVKRNVFLTVLFTLIIFVNLFLLVLLNLNTVHIKNIADNKFGNYINSTFHDYWPGHESFSGNDRNWEDRILKMKHWQKNISEISSFISSHGLQYDFIASDNFNLSPLLKFYMKKDNVYLLGDLRFRYINSAEVVKELKGKDAVIVIYMETDPDFLNNEFEVVNEIKELNFPISEDLIQKFRIIQCRNFKPEFVSADE